MRDLTTKERIFEFITRLSKEARSPVRVYLTGGSTAVLLGWRESTVDVDIRFEPEADEIFRAIPKLKEDLRINVELASPPDFIPEVPGWRDRSIYIDTIGSISFYHFDPYSQALSKIERGHEKDRTDVASMLSQGLIETHRLIELFELIRPNLYKYPAINESNFASAVHALETNDPLKLS
jgi:hypothetical protein